MKNIILLFTLIFSFSTFAYYEKTVRDTAAPESEGSPSTGGTPSSEKLPGYIFGTDSNPSDSRYYERGYKRRHPDQYNKKHMKKHKEREQIKKAE